MDHIGFKDIRVLPNALDLKNNANKSLSEILKQLQSGAVLKGLVVGTNNKNEVIFHTAYGRFAAPNNLNLVRGDTINMKLDATTGQIAGTLLSVNNKNVQSNEPVHLGSIQQPPKQENNAPKALIVQTNNPVELKHSGNIPKTINGNVSYLNLIKLDKGAPLPKLLSAASNNVVNNKMPISLNVLSGRSQGVSAFIVNGVVSGNNTQGNQLITTNFGIIASEGTKMPIGQKLSLEVTSVNNKSLGNNIGRTVNEFMFNINKNWPTIKNFALPPNPGLNKTVQAQNIPATNIQAQGAANITQATSTPQVSFATIATDTAAKNVHTQIAPSIVNDKLLTQNAELLQTASLKSGKIRSSAKFSENAAESNKTHKASSANRDTTTPNSLPQAPKNDEASRGMNSIIKNMGANLEEIKKLSTEFHNIKELMTAQIKPEEANQRWQSLMLPFQHGERVEEYEVKIDRSRKHFLRFLFDVNLENNKMQVDGLITFTHDDKTPKEFDLTIRSQKNMDSALQKRIADIYMLNQNMTGVRGSFSLEGADKFVQT